MKEKDINTHVTTRTLCMEFVSSLLMDSDHHVKLKGKYNLIQPNSAYVHS